MARVSKTISYDDCGDPNCPPCRAKAHLALATQFYLENSGRSALPPCVQVTLDLVRASTVIAVAEGCKLEDLLDHVRMNYGRAQTSLNLSRIIDNARPKAAAAARKGN